jgi:endonuclease/exonuclease/phosphatase family metal-dependent hydrolase
MSRSRACLIAGFETRAGLRGLTVSRVRLATYNLLHGVPLMSAIRSNESPQLDMMPTVDAALLRDSVEQLAPDVIGLQEVDFQQERSAGTHQTRIVAETMDAQWWMFAPSVHGTPPENWRPATSDDAHTMKDAIPHGPQYGVGFASRFPVLHARSICLPGARASIPLLVPTPAGSRLMKVPDEPRAAIAAVIDSPIGTISVATAHLSFVPGVNVWQLRRLVHWLSDLPRPLFLMGDFNLPGRVPALTTRWQPLARAATYPAYRPLVQFDHVLADGLPKQKRPSATHVMALPVSDHCALAIDIPIDIPIDVRPTLRK